MVRSKGIIDARFDLGQRILFQDGQDQLQASKKKYDLDGLAILGTFIGLEVVREALNILGNFRMLGSVQMIDHAVVSEGEE